MMEQKTDLREVVFTYYPAEGTMSRTSRGPMAHCWISEQQELPTETVKENIPQWKKAVDPPEGGGIRWKPVMAVVIILLISALCLIAGMMLSLKGVGGHNAEGEPSLEPPKDVLDQIQSMPAKIPDYPTGGNVRMSAASAEGLPELTPQEVYAAVRPSTVTVAGQTGPMLSVGTGVILSEDGYILTNYHVIAGCTLCSVMVTDEYNVDSTYEAKLVGGDRERDIAVLKIEAEGLTCASFGVSDELTIGDKVYAIGNPLGLELRATFTDGIISAVNREVDVDGITMTLLQTNAALNSGNSGGPLINQYGQVVGINTIKMVDHEDTVEGLGFAIPTSIAARWVNELIATGEIRPEPTLGITINRIPETLPDGRPALRIIEVTQGLGAEAAGILPDDLLVSFDDRPIYRMEDVLAIRRDLHVGDLVPVQVFRDGEYLTITMELMELKSY